MEKYIITDEDGQHYVAREITVNEQIAVSEGIISIIRCSDGKQLSPSMEWEEPPIWGLSFEQF